MRCAVIGSVDSTQVALRALKECQGVTVAAIVSLRLELAKRHADFADVAPEAEALGAALIRTDNANNADVIAALRQMALDYLIVVGWSQLCGPELMATAAKGTVGYHPAALPRLRGRAAIPWTILLDEKITGSSLFWIDADVDSGPIIAQRLFHVAEDETSETLYAKHMVALDAIMREAAGALAAGRQPRLVQDERLATWCAKRTPEDGRIDWAQPASLVWRLVRAAGKPYPGAFTTQKGETLRIWAAAPWPQGGDRRYHAMIGQIVAIDDTGFAVRCGDGQDLWVSAYQFDDAPPKTPLRLHAKLGT